MGSKKFAFPRLGSELKSDWIDRIKLNPKVFVFIPIVVIFAFFFRQFSAALILIILTIAVSYLAQKMKLKKFGIELVTFTTVVTGVSFGALPGAIVGISLMAIHHIITRRVGLYWIIVMPVFGAIGALASMFSNTNLLVLGVGLTLFSHVMYIAFQKAVFKSSAKYMFYVILNVLFNGFLFYRAAPYFVKTIIFG